MKTIYSFTGLVIMFLMPLDLPAQTGGSKKPFPYAFSVAALTGFFYGQGEEIVYKTPDNDTYLSELLWDMKPLFYAGLGLACAQTNPLEKWGGFVSLSLKFGIPGKTGVMEDRDWISPSHSRVTHFSSHDNYTQGALLLDISGGLSFPVVSKVLIKAYLTFSYMRFVWDSQNGYVQYGTPQEGTDYDPWNPSLPKTPLYGPAISYIQEWFIAAPGIGADVPFLKIFSAGVTFHITPLLWCFARDEHFSRNLEFSDQTAFGLLLEPKVGFTFSPLPKLDIALAAGYRRILGSRGATYSRTTGLNGSENFIKNGSAGAGYWALDLGLSVKVRL
jgi:outer membrane protease